jgi:hypothetical protein
VRRTQEDVTNCWWLNHLFCDFDAVVWMTLSLARHFAFCFLLPKVAPWMTKIGKGNFVSNKPVETVSLKNRYFVYSAVTQFDTINC